MSRSTYHRSSQLVSSIYKRGTRGGWSPPAPTKDEKFARIYAGECPACGVGLTSQGRCVRCGSRFEYDRHW